MWIRALYRSWDEPRSQYGDAVVVAFLVMQCVDGEFTYLGVGIWGPSVEANPIVASAMMAGGPTIGFFGARLVAIAFGMLLHLRRIHNMVALLTAIYFVMAIVPWAALLLIR